MTFFKTNKQIIESVEDKTEIVTELLKIVKTFTTIETVNSETKFKEISIENIGAMRDSLEYRFGVYILNNEWENLVTIDDITSSIEKKINIKNK